MSYSVISTFPLRFDFKVFCLSPELTLTTPVSSAHSIGLSSANQSAPLARDESSRKSLRVHRAFNKQDLKPVTCAERSKPPICSFPISSMDQLGSQLRFLLDVIDHMLLETAPDGRWASSPERTPRFQSYSFSLRSLYSSSKLSGVSSRAFCNLFCCRLICSAAALKCLSMAKTIASKRRREKRQTFLFSLRIKAISNCNKRLWRRQICSPLRATSTRPATESTKFTSVTPRTSTNTRIQIYLPSFQRASIGRTASLGA